MLDNRKCLVLRLKEKGRIPFGKHEAHPSHNWWYTRWGGGHQMPENWKPDGSMSHDGSWGWDTTERDVFQFRCQGV